ncbi:MAG: DUF4173 domain-containing protein [Oscillospiraceae bacterium]|nr:DUF4173 domain-containing protein [Oscillospiraceae bacterium]
MNESAAPIPRDDPVTWRVLAAPLCALGLAWLFWAGFAPANWGIYGPGLGIFVLVAAHFAAVLLMLGSRACWSPGAVLLTGASLVLALCAALYSLPSLALFNCFVILATAAIATFALSGQCRYRPGQLMAVFDTIHLTLLALCSEINAPFRLLRQVGKARWGRIGRGVLAVVIALPVVGLVIWLLSSADPVFESLVDIHLEWNTGPLAMKILRIAILALFISSGLYFLQKPADASVAAPVRELDRTRLVPSLLTGAVLLDIVYILFCAIQIQFLFGGREAAVMAGGWAAYARSGFFQLAAVAAINLTLCLAGTDRRCFEVRGGQVLRAALALLLACTAVILLSAARRMQLYILAYGLSVLRLTTLFVMAVTLIGLLAAGYKLARPGFPFFKTVGTIALISWCLLCLANPAGLTARYNVNAYLAGQLETVDVEYLESLGTDSLPALTQLAGESAEDGPRASAAIARLTAQAREERMWTQWKASFLQAR